MFITALPQSTAEVERTFFHLNNNKNKLSDFLAVCTLEAIIKSSENFPGDFERLTHLHGKARKIYFEKFENSEAVGAITVETLSPFLCDCELQPAGELQGIMLNIYCQRCWLILEDIKTIFFNNVWLCRCSGDFCKCNDACFTHVILILHS